MALLRRGTSLAAYLCVLSLCLQGGSCQPPDGPDAGVDAGPVPYCSQGGVIACGAGSTCPASSTCINNETTCACNAGYQKVDCTGAPCTDSTCSGTEWRCDVGPACSNQEPFCGGATVSCGSSTCPAGSTCLTATNQCQCNTNIVDCCGHPCGTEAACGTAYVCGSQ